MDFSTSALQCFLSVLRNQSFTKAAESLGLSQSAVSQKISRLENMLGKNLFKRGKELLLTHDGHAFQEYAEKILNLHLEAVNYFRSPHLTSEIRFGLPEDFATRFLADSLGDFTRIHPHIFLNIECDLTIHLWERFQKNEFDMVLVKTSRPEDFPNGLEVWSEKLEWVGHKSILDRIFQEQKKMPLVLGPQPCVYRSRAIKSLDDAKIPWQIVFSSPSYNGNMAAVKAGLGITILPKTMVPDRQYILQQKSLPPLTDTHLSLLKNTRNKDLDLFENFVLQKLHP